jgi:transposase
MNDAQKLLRFAEEEKADPLRARRLRAVALVVDGMSISAAAREVGMDRPRLSHWCARYRAEGLEGLSDGRDHWRVDLTEDQLRQLKRWATARVGYDTWPTTIGLADRLEREFGIWASASTVQKLLRDKLGLLWTGGRWREP